MYLDGVLVGEQERLAGWQYRGAMDDIRFYSSALTESQVQELYIHEQWQAIPEPTTCTLALAALCLAIVRRSR
jgi:hypothetical protein